MYMSTHPTSSTVPARLVETVIHLHLTVCTRESRGALTGITALSGVCTCCAITTGLVVSAVVEICGNKEKEQLKNYLGLQFMHVIYHKVHLYQRERERVVHVACKEYVDFPVVCLHWSATKIKENFRFRFRVRSHIIAPLA